MEILRIKFISKFICRFKRGKEILTILDVYFGGARAVLGKQGNNYELTICYKGRYFVQQIKSKYRTEEVIDIAAEEVKKFIKSRSWRRLIINQLYGKQTTKVSQVGNPAING